MSKLFCSLAASLFIFSILAVHPATAQSSDATPPSLLSRQLARVELALTGQELLTSSVNGNNYLGTNITQKASVSTGVLASIRYTRSRYVGFEYNYAYGRYTESYTCPASSPYCTQSVTGGPCSGSVSASTTCPAFINGGAQLDPFEYSLGYVVHPKPLLGFEPYVSVGAGTTAFRPTRYGGQGLPEQYRATYYYSIGAEKTVFSPHFGVRAQMREVFFKAPDQLQNYLTINKRTTTLQPGIGFFLRF